MRKKRVVAVVALALAIPAAIASSILLLPCSKAKAEEGEKKGSLQHVSDVDFEKEVLKANTPVLVDFYADWCGPCRKMGPVIEEISKEMKGKVKVVKVNVDNSRRTAQTYQITSIPAMFIFKKGQVVDKIIGFTEKQEVVAAINKQL